MQIDSTTTRLVVVPAGGLLSGRRVGCSPGLVGSPAYGLLTAAEGQINQRTEVVRLLPVGQVPQGALAVGADLAAKLGVGGEENAAWRLSAGGLSHAAAAEVCLEVQMESQLDQIVEQLNRSQDLVGQLLWKPADAGLESLWLEVSGTPYRVRQLAPQPAPHTVLEITNETRVTVFAPGIKTAVDIVVLADCSGSMSLSDLTDMSDAVPTAGGFGGLFGRSSPVQRTIQRIEALRRALTQLLEMRLRHSGRVSRIALVSFTHECGYGSVRFPRHGAGMAEMDANSPPEVVKDFRDAIGLLRAEERGGTQIAPALHFAAKVLHEHGRPGNDRLIVLISDGASWQAKGEADTGREIGGLEDEVSLMDHLHRSMDIYLHAIGISNEAIFRPWFARTYPGQQPHIASIPNHALLERLVEVGGGDPSRTGDTDVLQSYFSGLGSGVSRQVRPQKASPPPPLSQEEAAALDEARAAMARTSAIPAGVSGERESLAEEIIGGYLTVNEIAERLTGEMLFESMRSYPLLHNTLRKEVSDPESFRHFIIVTVAAILVELNEKVRQDAAARSDTSKRPAGYEIPAVVDVASSQDARNLRLLRNANAHPELKDKKDQVRLGEVFMQGVRVSYIEPEDAARWAEMHLFVLRKFHSLVGNFLDAYRQEEARRAAALSSAGAAPDTGTQADAQAAPRFRLVE